MSNYVSRTPIQQPRNPRRMTLGGVPTASDAKKPGFLNSIDAATVNSVSAGGAPPSSSNIPKSTRRPPKARQSMIPRMGRENVPNTPGGATSVSSSVKSTASSRRRSIGPEGATTKRRQSVGPPPLSQRTDPRPIGDKTFQQQCIKELLNFLLEHGFEYPVSTKSLARPSAKDFTNIATFMLRQIDKDFGRGTMKFEDEVALNFKVLGYPYTVSKTSLVAAGSMHTWPSLLAALTWLVHLMEGENAFKDNEKDTRFESIEELHAKSDADFYRFIGKAYKAWMDGDKEAVESIETNFTESFEGDNAFIEQTAERVTDVNATLVERIREMEQQAGDLPEYAKKRESYATDLEQFHDLIRQMDEHKKGLEIKVIERTTELAQTNKKLDKMTTYIDELKQTIKEQEFSVHDIHKMESELKGLLEASDRAHAALDQQQTLLNESEKELINVTNKLDILATNFNTCVSSLQLVPELNSKFSSFKVILNKEKLLETDQNQILGIDLVETVQPVVLSSKQEFAKLNVRDEKVFNEFVDKLNRSEDACNEVEAKLRITQEKHAKCECTIDSEEKTQQAKLAVRKREVESMESKVASLQDPVALEEQMAAYERQCAELEALRIEHEAENVAKYQAVLGEINSACHAMEEHDTYVRQRLSELHEYWREQMAETVEIVAPDNIDPVKNE